ncbi:tyrosyl-tRNA synthetase [Fusarium bulbicola]|nr:tyrosyl-tRNA synthetase [Fusarium bulbicola]
MTPEESIILIKANLAEILNPEIIDNVILKENRPLRVYWGTAPTGEPHCGYFVPMVKIAELLHAGCHVKILLADKHLIKASSEVVKQGNNPTLGSVEYPIWQSLDEEYLDVDAELGGVDQRTLFTFAIDHMPKLGYKVRAHLMNAIAPGLGEAQKMSSSEPSSKVNLLDTPEEVTKRLRKAVCASKQVEGNGVIAFIEHVIFRVESLKTGGEPRFKVETRDGDTLVYEDISKLKEDYASDALTPQMMKPALIKTLNELLGPIRRDFEADEDWQRVAQLAYPPEERSKKTKMGKKKGKVQHELPIRTRQD